MAKKLIFVVFFIVCTAIIIISYQAIIKEQGPVPPYRESTGTVTGPAVPDCSGGQIKTRCQTGRIPVTLSNGSTTTIKVLLDDTIPSSVAVYQVNETWSTTKPVAPPAPTNGFAVIIFCIFGTLLPAVGLIQLTAIVEEADAKRASSGFLLPAN